MKLAAILLLVLVAGAGCDRAAIEPNLELGVSTCHRCQSVIEKRLWAAADRHDGEIRLYDDPGCLFATRRDDALTDADAVFQDHGGSGRWIPAESVWFAWTKTFASPQGYGWGAFPSFAAAQDAVTSAGSGRIVRYAEALSAVPPTP